MIRTKKDEEMNQNWADLNKDGRCIERHLRMLDRKLKKTTDPEIIIKYCNSICYLTSSKIELVSIVLGIK
ncbi:hypothetical protein [Nitrosopumilus sp. b2]|uniref:hypothetical protein n=1 Tax=Nitrosopumilus sp. b2 TaxID=2109908 RepID=UPI0015F4A53F|nr:hypothetical protein [Nitrosopumilus sp. b2]KAF6244333.1 hypothetical protein C6989_08610 [Nitrosopumilus sp. b2]